MNLLELREYFWDIMDDPHQGVWSVGRVDRLLNFGMQSLVRSMEDTDVTYFGDCEEYAVPAAATDEVYFDLPANNRRVIGAERVVDNAEPIQAEWYPFSTRHTGPVRGRLAPQLSIMGRRLFVLFPGEAYTLRLWFAHTPAKLEIDTDEPADIPEDFHELIVLEAAKRAYGIAEKAFPLEDLRQQQIAALMVASTPRQRQGPRHVRYVEE